MNSSANFELPTTDRLTGLLTLFYYRHLLREDLLPNSEKTGQPLSLFLLDTDNFRLINSTYGHACGDKVLLAVANILQAVLPKQTAISRYGGDEFSAALPGTRLDDAFTLAEDVRRRVADLAFGEWPDLRCSCSIGLAAFVTHGGRDVELFREADQALYLAKTTGRNKVALPLADSRMITKTSHYTSTQLERLARLGQTVDRSEATLLREALDDLLKKYNDRLEAEYAAHTPRQAVS